MYISVTNRRFIAIWLSAILLIMSVAASAHSVEHIDEGAKTHCTLCFHQHQFDQVLPQQDANLEFIYQQYDVIITVQPTLILSHSVTYLSRAPPASL
ncbi:ABC-type zinc uptake system zinc chaperone [Colwellia sp. M166]|uniref:ABC-type zinc uptake system zinc chaperone n=1 Tax=Colwellia sp. M166 TaxID=2583805 RepID=UPI00211EC85E|nr:ABC-type zinc uptake system zinc chaperone [Colwellia sp. M166]UUO24442.1 ABC-type zinc uptake system zinc chaperone [Colwellia sp. M166]